jgi:hypothetical protein
MVVLLLVPFILPLVGDDASDLLVGSTAGFMKVYPSSSTDGCLSFNIILGFGTGFDLGGFGATLGAFFGILFVVTVA